MAETPPEMATLSTMLRVIDDSEKVTNIVCTPGGNQGAWFLIKNDRGEKC